MLNVKELRGTNRAMATFLRRLATRLSTSSLNDPAEIRRFMHSNAEGLRDVGMALDMVADA